jgi:hypothetical protein
MFNAIGIVDISAITIQNNTICKMYFSEPIRSKLIAENNLIAYNFVLLLIHGN